MKRISLGLATLSLAVSLGAYAALPTQAVPFQVVVPNLSPGFEFNVTGFLLQPTNNNEDYAVAVYTPSEDLLQTYNVKTTNPGYDFGFGLGIGYIFPNSGNDVRLSWWTYLNSKTTDYVDVSKTFELLDNLYDSLFNSVYTEGSGTEDIQYDAVDLDAGQFIDVGTNLQIRLATGVRYVHLKRDFLAQLDSKSEPGFFFVDTDYTSRFDGVGPLFSVDSAYHLGGGLGLVGHFDGTLAIGSIRASSSINEPRATPQLAQIPGAVILFTPIDANDETRIVPGVDARLGLDFSYPFNCDCSVFSVEVGWQATHYFNAVDTIQPTDVALTLTNIFVNSVERNSSDIGFNGPYLSLNLKV